MNEDQKTKLRKQLVKEFQVIIKERGFSKGLVNFRASLPITYLSKPRKETLKALATIPTTIIASLPITLLAELLKKTPKALTLAYTPTTITIATLLATYYTKPTKKTKTLRTLVATTVILLPNTIGSYTNNN